MKPVVAISLGDPSGIGPEVIARAIVDSRVQSALVPFVVGDEGVVRRAAKTCGVSLPALRLDAVTTLSENDATPGHPSSAGARAQLAYLESALAHVRTGRAAALCTAPVNKAAIARTGIEFTGHTEWLTKCLDAKHVVMMLAGEKLRVALATTHLALARVPSAISVESIAETIVVTDRALRMQFGTSAPRIAVCGLNPHAGEDGAFGDEESRIIRPALDAAARRGVDVRGPFAADGLFPRAALGAFDAVVALYHDQGLIPVKLLEFEKAVNVTLGLPIVRTSPDHGVAYDIAGTGRAQAESMISALLLAAKLTSAR